MNFPLIAILLSAAAAALALATIDAWVPGAGAVVGLSVMGTGLLGAAWHSRRRVGEEA